MGSSASRVVPHAARGLDGKAPRGSSDHRGANALILRTVLGGGDWALHRLILVAC